jgi:hypothetical protein
MRYTSFRLVYSVMKTKGSPLIENAVLHYVFVSLKIHKPPARGDITVNARVWTYIASIFLLISYSRIFLKISQIYKVSFMFCEKRNINYTTVLGSVR